MNKNNLEKQIYAIIPLFIVLLILASISNDSFAKQTHSLDDIAMTAHDFVMKELNRSGENIEVVVGQLDPRLRLHQCTVPLEAFRQNYENRRAISTVGVRCNDNKPWSLYVPVSVKNFKQVAILKHAVIRNTVISENDIVLDKRNINRLTSGYFDAPEQLIGKIITQNLSSGAVLTKHHIKAATAVNRGQSVTLIAKNSVIEVRMKGVAMSKGAIGERIKVKNTNSERIIEGIIIDKDLISVNL